MTGATCELCSQDGGEVVYRSEKLRVVLVDDANYPGFCRVIWNAHTKEMTDLVPADRSLLMSTVCKVEQVVREVMHPAKINLASLGNMTPHLHWHVIPRYIDDAHFPSPVWVDMQRIPTPESMAPRREALNVLRSELPRVLAAQG